MPLTDATNSTAVAPEADAAALKAKQMSSGAPGSTPNPEKLGIALDAIASFHATARDDATAKLDTAATKDAAGLSIALLGVACDETCAPTRRLAAATFARNCLRKQWGTRDDALDESKTETSVSGAMTPESRTLVRTAALKALVVAPIDTRRLLADCLRLAATDAVEVKSEGTTTEIDRFASAANLVEDVIELAASSSTLLENPGLLLATHVASLPFQYFRDPTVAHENAHPATERLCEQLVVPKLVPALTELAENGTHSSKHKSHTVRVAFKVLFRLVRAHLPISLGPALTSVVDSIGQVCAELNPDELDQVPAEYWISVKRGLRLGAALVSRHADALDTDMVVSLVAAARRVASLIPGLAPPPATAAAFALLRAALDRSNTRDALAPVETAKDEKARDAAQRVALADLVRTCVLPHVSLTDDDRNVLMEDPEEYARSNACGEAAEDDAIEETLDGVAGGVTSRRAALDFVEHLCQVSFESEEAAKAKQSKKPKKDKTSEGTKGDDADGQDGTGSKPTVGELAARDVTDAMLVKAPKEKVEKVGKAAAASGSVVAHVAPAAEQALGESEYVGVLRVQGVLTSASRMAKESATRQFCRKHAFPAVAAGNSPHVVVAAAVYCAEVAAKITTAVVAREAFSACVAALERPTPFPSEDEDEEEDEEAWRVTRDAASWAARAVVAEAPCSEEAFGVASSESTMCLTERLVQLAESNPARGAAPIRALAGLAEAASSAIAPDTAAALAGRIIDAYAKVLPNDDEDDEMDADTKDETTLDAWETSVEAVAALCECAENWETVETDDEAKTKQHALAKTKLAAIAARHVRTYWQAASLLEPPSFAVGEDDCDADADMEELVDVPPAHPAAAPMLQFACETLAEGSSVGTVDAATSSEVWSVAGAWASFLPSWRLKEGDGILDDAALDALTAIIGACVEANVGEDAMAAVAVPGACAAVTTLNETEDAATRLAAARAVAAAVAACASAATPEVVTAARDASDAAVNRRASRAALHLLVAVAWASPAVASDPAGWMRAIDDAACAAGWNACDSDDVSLLAAHCDACTCMLTAATKQGQSAPDKRLLGVTLTEAMKCVNELVDDFEEEDDNDDDDSDDESDGSDDDSDDKNNNLEHETEADFLERYAAIARDMAEGGDDEDEDEIGDFSDVDESFSNVFLPTLGDGEKSVKRFVEWYGKWKEGGSSGLRTATLVDTAVAKRFEKKLAKLVSA